MKDQVLVETLEDKIHFEPLEKILEKMLNLRTQLLNNCAKANICIQ